MAEQRVVLTRWPGASTSKPTTRSPSSAVHRNVTMIPAAAGGWSFEGALEVGDDGRRVAVDLVPRVADHAEAGAAEDQLAAPILLVGDRVGVRFVAIELDDQTRVAPERVDLEPVDGGVDLGDREAGALDEQQELPLEVIARPGELWEMERDGAAEGRGAWPPAPALAFDRSGIEELAVVSLGESAAEQPEVDNGGQVEEGASHGRDRQAALE